MAGARVSLATFARLGAGTFPSLCTDADNAAFGRELVCVGEEIDEYLCQAVQITVDERQVCGDLNLEGLMAQGEQGAQQGLRVLHDVAQVDALAADAQLSGLDADALEQIVDQTCQPQRAALEGAHELLQLLFGHGLHTLEQ